MKIVVMNHITLDGVMQSPGRVDEDTKDGFDQGRWAAKTSDEAVGQAMGGRMAAGGGLAGWLFGRRTYEELQSSSSSSTFPPSDTSFMNRRTANLLSSAPAMAQPSRLGRGGTAWLANRDALNRARMRGCTVKETRQEP